jgi:hypothetical protein
MLYLELNRAVEKFGIPQFRHSHDILLALHTCKLTQTTGVIVSQLKVNRSRPVSKYIFILLLANAFDIETNPGPKALK